MMATWMTQIVVFVALGSISTWASSVRVGSDQQDMKALLRELLDKGNVEESSSELSDRGHIDSAKHPSLFGVAILDHKLYVADDSSKSIQIYDCTSLENDGEIKVDGVKYITDLVASDQTKYLYVLDKYPSNRVKKIDPVGKTSTEFIDLGDEDMLSTPIALSVQKDHMLIIPKFAHKLSVYDISSGQLLKTLQLKKEIVPRHAVETASGSFLVLHIGSKGSPEYDGVSEYSADGTFLKMYGGQRGSGPSQLNKPVYLVLDKNGNALVADFENRRVVEVSSDLSSGKELISTADLQTRQGGDDGNKNGRPWRLVVEGSTLYVGIATGDVKTFDLK